MTHMIIFTEKYSSSNAEWDENKKQYTALLTINKVETEVQQHECSKYMVVHQKNFAIGVQTNFCVL